MNSISSIKSIIETKDNLIKNEEEKYKPHKLLRMQQCMLYDQLDNPSINVHNLTRIYKLIKADINIEKFIISLNKAIKHHPCFLTVLHNNNDDTYSQIYRPDLFNDIKLEKYSNKEFIDHIYPNILYNFQDNLYDKLLINYRVIETEEFLYLIMDHHHIFFDGYSIKLLIETFEKIYEDKEIIEDMYFLKVKELEDIINTYSNTNIVEYMNKEYDLKTIVGCPIKDKNISDKKGLVFCQFDMNNLITKFKNILNNNDIMINNIIVMASLCAIAYNTKNKEVMVTWSYHGRHDQISKYIAGNLVRIYPVKFNFNNECSILDFYNNIVLQAKDLLHRPYYPHILYSTDGEIMNNIYQKDLFIINSFAGNKMEYIIPPSRNLNNGVFNNQVIDACYFFENKNINVQWQYPLSKYTPETMNKFKDLFINYLEKLLDNWNNKNKINILNIINK